MEFLTREVAGRRVTQIRDVMTDQLDTTSQMLKSMAEGLELSRRFDLTATQRVSDVIIRSGITPIDISCRIDRCDRMMIEAEIAQVGKSRLNKTDLAR